jgi:hypothetical protein
MPKLTLDDIVDLRAYERERDEFRADVIALKKKRRVSVGPVITLLFENAMTIRFQIQEMARAEKIITDEGIETELRIYNPLIPEPGTLAATMFIELTSDEQLREWLPRLVGIERALELRFADAVVPCEVDADHEKQLTRDEITASVHYIHFRLSPEQVAAYTAADRDGSVVTLAFTHPAYEHAVVLGPDTVHELACDLRDGG